MQNELSKIRAIKSYVIRKGRMTDAQKQAVASYLEQYGLKHDAGLWDFDAIFGRQAPRILEIGFGMGASLFEMAQQSPQEDFIGIEVHPPGVGALLAKVAEAGLSNVRVCMADAREVLERAVPDNSLARLQLFFPDPWPKARHHKRRIVQPDFIKLVWTKLQTGANLHIATDWKPYAEYILEVMSGVQGFDNLSESGTFVQKPTYRPSTKYEVRGQRLGHPVFDLIFTKKS